MRRALITFTLASLMAMAFPAAAWASDLYVVVNAKSPVRSLNKRDVIALFTGRTRAFPNGDLAMPLDHLQESPAREAFYQLLTGMDLARINSYWSRLLFTGQVQPPLPLANDAAVVAQIKRDANAIGYLVSESTDPALRVVLVLH